jgi:hypothetical protein
VSGYSVGKIKQYEVFRRTYQRALIFIQKKTPAEVQPEWWPYCCKVARHSFAIVRKNLMIETDITRELMGHERDDVDNYYKDKYPEKCGFGAFEIISPLSVEVKDLLFLTVSKAAS